MEQIGDYCVLTDQRLGSGAFGEAFKCYRKDRRDVEYCIKIIKKFIQSDSQKDKNQKRQLDAEINTFQSLKEQQCENLVKMIDMIHENSRLCIVMELCEYDLSKELNLLKQKKSWLSRKEMVDMIKQILKGAQALIQNHIIHRDIKPQNILVKVENRGTQKQRKIYKIADFGFSKYLDDIYAKANLTRVGTRSYCAPEIMKGEQFSCKCDIYSYGIVFHQIVYNMEFPEHYATEQQLKNFFSQIQINPYRCKKLEGQHGDMITSLIEKMIVYDQDKRISYDELFSHEIMKMPPPIINDSIFLPIERTVNDEDYKQQMLKNEAEKFDRFNQLISIFYRKFLLCKNCVDLMKQNLIIDQIEILIFLQLIQLIGFQQITFGFAMINLIIDDLESTISYDNDIPWLMQQLEIFITKSAENQKYKQLQEKLTNDYYQAKETYKQDLNKLILLKVQQQWPQNKEEFQLLQKSKIKKITIQTCCQVLQKFAESIRISDWVNRGNNNIKQQLETIKQIDTKFVISQYREINPDDIFKI